MDTRLANRDRILSALARDGLTDEQVVGLLRELEDATIDEQTIAATDKFLRICAGRKSIVATFDEGRRPGVDEVVVIFGNYPHVFENIVVNNPIKRHVSSFWALPHDAVEADERWREVDAIYLINSKSRLDRWHSVLRELARAHAPFDRIVRIVAIEPGERTRVNGTIGCLQSHIAAIRKAQQAGHSHVLIMEDDFSFTSDVDAHLDDLATFISRRYDYWICLLGTSKYGVLHHYDDLLDESFQSCTNTEAYLLSRSGMDALLPVYLDAEEQLIRTHDTHCYAADRCWSVLQGNGKFLSFRRKFGFQIASVSDIEGEVNGNFD